MTPSFPKYRPGDGGRTIAAGQQIGGKMPLASYGVLAGRLIRFAREAAPAARSEGTSSHASASSGCTGVVCTSVTSSVILASLETRRWAWTRYLNVVC